MPKHNWLLVSLSSPLPLDFQKEKTSAVTGKLGTGGSHMLAVFHTSVRTRFWLRGQSELQLSLLLSCPGLKTIGKSVEFLGLSGFHAWGCHLRPEGTGAK